MNFGILPPILAEPTPLAIQPDLSKDPTFSMLQRFIIFRQANISRINDRVWKLTAEAFGVRQMVEVTYPVGLDASGNAILSKIYAIKGIDAVYKRRWNNERRRIR